MLTQLLPKTLRNTMFVSGILMLGVSMAMDSVDSLDPEFQAPEAMQCQVEPSLTIEEVADLS